MIKRIPMEDWLRGCVYHDGRHGEVTLPTDKVLKIANYIQRTRRSTTDGLIDLEVVEADRKTEPQTERESEWRTEAEIKAYVDGYNDCFRQFKECLRGRKSVVDSIRKMELFVTAVNSCVESEPQTEREKQ